MGSKEIDKTKPKNWIDGDTFAVKIENTNTEYDGRYIILNKYSMPKGNPKINYFRAMITLNEDYPSLDQINNLEYIKIIYRTFYERYYPLSGGETFAECVMRKSHLKFYPDEYNYLYSYTIEFDVKGNKDVQKMKYIGNKIIDAPYDEYFINGDEIKSQYIPSNDLIQKLIKAYEGYNKKKSIIYDPKQQKIIDRKASCRERV